ncbi:MAG: VCBS repeat-containing protein [Ignavibacteriales bacterium]|nr:VCBS repeat-containing protein [Ignavibacteriales bacterium]
MFGSGSQIGQSGWYCVYNGTGTTVTATGLAIGDSSRVAVCEYMGTNGAETFFTTPAADNPKNIKTITTQAGNIAFANTGAAKTDITWINGNGSRRAVFISRGTTGSPVPVDNTTYTADTVFGSGTQIGSSGWYCVYNGTGTTVSAAGLAIGDSSRVAVCEYMGANGAETYFTATGTNNPKNIKTITTQAGNIAFANTGAAKTDITWINGNGSRRAVFVLHGTTGSPAPVNNTTYTADTVFGSGTQIGSSGWYCVYNGTGTTVTATGLAIGDSSRVAVCEYMGANGAETFFTTTEVNNPKNAGTIATQAGTITFANTGAAQTDINWSNGNGSRRAVFVNHGTSGSPLPVNNITYTADTVFGSGTQIGSTGWYCVYNGTGVSVIVTGLPIGDSSRVAVCEYSGADGAEKFFTTTGTNNPQNVGTIALQASGITFANTGVAQTDISWLNGNGSRRAVFVANSATGSPLPVNNITYTASTAFSSGTQIGSSGWYCVYNGTGTTVEVTGLTVGQTYRASVAEYIGADGAEQYFTTTGQNNPANAPAINIPTPVGNAISFMRLTSYLNIPSFSWAAGGPITIEFWNFVTNVDLQDLPAVKIGNGTLGNTVAAYVPWLDRNLYWDYGDPNNSGRIAANYQSYMDQWTHVALVSGGNAGSFRGIYLNGVLVAAIGASDGPDIALTNLKIGGANNAYSHTGNMDDFRIWNTVRSQAEIQGSMSTTLAGTEPGLMGYWRFDEGAGLIANDATQHNNSGTLTNNANWVVPSTAPINAGMNQAFNVTFTDVNWSSTAIAWKNGNGSARSVFMFHGNEGTPVPEINTVYTADSSFGSGTQIGSSGWYCIYNGAGERTTVHGLLPGEIYRVAVCEYLVSGPNKQFYTSNATKNPANVSTVSKVQASAIMYSNVQSTHLNISWTRGNGTRSAVFVQQGINGSALPVYLTTYNAGSIFGTGTQIGTSGWYCVYNGTGTNASISGLTPGQIYRSAVMEYLGDNGREFYNTDSALNNPANSPLLFTVINKYPAPNAQSIAPNTNISATLNKALNPDSLNSGTFVVYGSLSGRHDGNIALDISGTSFTFTPAHNFIKGELVTVSLTSSVKSAEGGYLSNGQHWMFSIKPETTTADFSTAAAVSTTIQSTSGCSGDFNTDGLVDFATVSFFNNSISIFLNGGNGGFTETVIADPYPAPAGIVAADLNNDGKLDLAVSGLNNYLTVAWMNNGSGVFSSGSVNNTGGNCYGIAAGDISGDGISDIIVGNSNNKTLSILINNGNGTFTTSVQATSGDPRGLAISDVNADGNLDVIATNFSDGAGTINNTLDVFINSGNGSLTLSGTPYTGSGPFSVATGDFNNDGSIDLATANYGAASISILLNNGSGTFTQSSAVSTGSFPYHIASADFNGDGAMDLMATNYGSSTVSVFTNNGSGVFLQNFSLAAGASPFFSLPVDYNNDGIIDIAAFSGNSNEIFFYPNLSAPLPVELVSFTASARGRSLLLAWETATEVNNSGFVIEHLGGIDSSYFTTGGIKWKTIGFVAGAGNSNVKKEYAYTDVNPVNGKNYYRLKQIDNNGSFSYSDTIEAVYGNAPREFLLTQNYPNPFNPSTVITFTVPANGRATLKIYNTLGQLVTVLLDGEVEAGTYNYVQFNAVNLATGLYFSRLEWNGKVQLKKMLFIK